MLKLKNIRDSASVKKSKRIGRGIGSGTGKTSGAGHKGQKARSGVAIKGFEGGQMPLHRRLPKRGFKNPFKVKTQQINFQILNNIIQKYNLNAEKINEKDLFEKKIFKKNKGKLKLLNIGNIEKAITIEISFASKKAIEIVEQVGGKVNLVEK